MFVPTPEPRFHWPEKETKTNLFCCCLSARSFSSYVVAVSLLTHRAILQCVGAFGCALRLLARYTSHTTSTLLYLSNRWNPKVRQQTFKHVIIPYLTRQLTKGGRVNAVCDVYLANSLNKFLNKI